MQHFEAIIVGGSYAGLSAGLSLARGNRKILILDSGDRCNKNSATAHNILSYDGEPSAEILSIGLTQLLKYPKVSFVKEQAIDARREGSLFVIDTKSDSFSAKSIIIATGVKYNLPDIKGFNECWGISILHCPYCHGVEAMEIPTAIVAAADQLVSVARYHANWSKDLTVITNDSKISFSDQKQKLIERGIKLEEKEIALITHSNGKMDSIVFRNGDSLKCGALYYPLTTSQKSNIASKLGCRINHIELIEVNDYFQTNIVGVYAVGDCSGQIRSIAMAVANGYKGGMYASNELIVDSLINEVVST